MSTIVTEVFISHTEHPGTPDEVVAKLVSMGWSVAEQQDGGYVLQHELIPGAQRIISR